MDVNNEEGQAIFEVMVFLPLFIFFFTIIFNIGSAINVSINQQKVTRRYFYYLAKGNSYLPTQSNLTLYKGAGVLKIVGMSFIGYRQEYVTGSEQPAGPCFRFSSFLTGETDETCEDASGADPSTTNFIRVFTGYGVCGQSYALREEPHQHWAVNAPSSVGVPDPRGRDIGCVLQ